MVWPSLLALALLLGMPATASSAEPASWERYTKAGNLAYDGRRYPEAEKMYKAALMESSRFGQQDIRLVLSIENLSRAYRAEKKLEESKALGERYRNVLSSERGIYERLGLEYRKDLPGFPNIQLNIWPMMRPRCYVCHSNNSVIPILYSGESETIADEDRARRGEIVLRGCTVGNKRWYCKACKQEW